MDPHNRREFSPRVSHDRDHGSGLGSAPELAARLSTPHERFADTGSSDAAIKFNVQKFCATRFIFD
jgi:hypothetical protein